MSAKAILSRETTTDEVLADVNLSGKTAIVTGGSSGIGRETVRALASVNCSVVIAARNIKAAETVANTIKDELGCQSIEVIGLDLLSLRSVKKFVETFLSSHDSLDILINNAGVMACAQSYSEDGFESQFQSNYLSHFLLSALLLPLLLKSAPSRVITLSSTGHQVADVDYDDPNFRNRPYDRWQAYGQSKSADALLSVALNHYVGDKGVTALSVHPGTIQTPLFRHQVEEDQKFLQELLGDTSIESTMKTVEQGAATAVWAATAKNLAAHGGAFLEDCQLAEAVDSANFTHGVLPRVRDLDSALRLWSLSEQLCEMQFKF